MLVAYHLAADNIDFILLVLIAWIFSLKTQQSNNFQVKHYRLKICTLERMGHINAPIFIYPLLT